MGKVRVIVLSSATAGRVFSEIDWKFEVLRDLGDLCLFLLEGWGPRGENCLGLWPCKGVKKASGELDEQ